MLTSFYSKIVSLVDNIRQISKEHAPNILSETTTTATPEPLVLIPLGDGEPSPASSTLYKDTLFSASFGPWSSLGCLRRCLSRRETFMVPTIIHQAIRFSPYALGNTVVLPVSRPSLDTATSLFSLFARSANVFYPVLEPAKLDEILSQCYATERDDAQGYTREFFYLVLAIGSHICKRNEVVLAAEADFYFRAATAAMSTNSEHYSRKENIFLFQRTLLICIYLLLSPGSGDIWRHLGFAIRLFFDLSHRPSMEVDEFHDILCTLTRTLYCLERYEKYFYGADLSAC